MDSVLKREARVAPTHGMASVYIAMSVISTPPNPPLSKGRARVGFYILIANHLRLLYKGSEINKPNQVKKSKDDSIV